MRHLAPDLLGCLGGQLLSGLPTGPGDLLADITPHMPDATLMMHPAQGAAQVIQQPYGAIEGDAANGIQLQTGLLAAR